MDSVFLNSSSYYIKYCNEEFYFNGTLNNINVFTYQPELDPPFIVESFNIVSPGDELLFVYKMDSLPIGKFTMIAISPSLPFINESIIRACSSIGSIEIHMFVPNCSTLVSSLSIIGFKGQAIGTATEGTGEISYPLNTIKPCPPSLSIVLQDNDSVVVKANGRLVNDQTTSFKTGLNVLVFSKDLSHMTITNFDTSSSSDVSSSSSSSSSSSTDTTNIQFNRFIQHHYKKSSVIAIVAIIPEGKDGSYLRLSSTTIQTIKEKLGSKYIDQYIGGTSKWVLISVYDYTLFTANEHATSANTCSASYYPRSYSSLKVSVGSCNRVYSSAQSYIYIDGRSKFTSGGDGLSITIYKDGYDESLVFKIVADDQVNNGSPSDIAVSKAANFILNRIPVGSVVAISLTTSPSSSFTIPQDLRDALKTLGANLSSKINNQSSYALIGRKGSPPGSAPEQISQTGPVSLSGCFSNSMPAIPYGFEIKAIGKGCDQIGGDSYVKFYVNSQEIKFDYSKALNMLVVRPDGSLSYLRSYDTGTSDSDAEAFIEDFNDVEDGYIAIATKGEWTQNLGDVARNLITSRLGGTNYGEYPRDYGSSYSIIGEVGASFAPVQSFCPRETSTAPNYPAISSIRVPGYDTMLREIGDSVLINGTTEMKIHDTTIVGSLSSDSIKVATIRIIRVEETLFDFIKSLPDGTKVICQTTNTSISSNEQRLAFQMIGGCKYDMKQPYNAVYTIIGVKGCSPGSAMENVSEINSNLVMASFARVDKNNY
ncbi:hypothetical protein DFA_07511 [Cavenderia fasciculata]|uniref:ILEI/PANDER domain-containing protein n=1 Tax=Cavenderia fasciculata TaxID=261658 RepID=F4PWM3_CACFS|nr:uncharacterized protein DFA_07511 [Cavenderia fasciculata]EGG20387.1 hypothetical protein DFA_07511 [Cavenderia fasciculata]|eukprot:XP_004367370.1 hypothetical protein DFA_07511 [Cavenderia fasciculata]